MYVVYRADDGLTISSIRVALAAIHTTHQFAGVWLEFSQPRLQLPREDMVRSRGVRATRRTPSPACLVRSSAGSPCEAAFDVSSCSPAEARNASPPSRGTSKAGWLSGSTLADTAIARLVKQAADAAGLATAADDQGTGLAELMWQTRHRFTGVALRCSRPADLWRNDVTEGVSTRRRNPGGRFQE